MKPSEAQNLCAEKSKVIAIRGGLILLPEKQSLVWCSTQATTANGNLSSQTYQLPSITHSHQQEILQLVVATPSCVTSHKSSFHLTDVL